MKLSTKLKQAIEEFIEHHDLDLAELERPSCLANLATTLYTQRLITFTMYALRDDMIEIVVPLVEYNLSLDMDYDASTVGWSDLREAIQELLYYEHVARRALLRLGLTNMTELT